MQVNRLSSLLFHSTGQHNRAQRDLLDLIAYRLTSDSLESVSDSVLERLFQLRSGASAGVILDGSSASDSSLHHYAQKVLMEYQKITSNELDETIVEGQWHYPTLQLLCAHPSPSYRYLKSWIDASLKIEFGLLVVQMTLTGRVTTSEAELRDYLQTHLVRYGGYSILTGYWEPNEETALSVLENKMSLLAATIEMNQRIYTKKNTKQLHQILFGNVQHSSGQKGTQGHRKAS
jgi:hypothetical protein